MQAVDGQCLSRCAPSVLATGSRWSAYCARNTAQLRRKATCCSRQPRRASFCARVTARSERCHVSGEPLPASSTSSFTAKMSETSSAARPKQLCKCLGEPLMRCITQARRPIPADQAPGLHSLSGYQQRLQRQGASGWGLTQRTGTPATRRAVSASPCVQHRAGRLHRHPDTRCTEQTETPLGGCRCFPAFRQGPKPSNPGAPRSPPPGPPPTRGAAQQQQPHSSSWPCLTGQLYSRLIGG